MFWPRVRWMYEGGDVEPKIPSSLRDFGFSIERDSLVQRIHLWRAFLRSSKGSDVFLGRPSKVKLRPAIAIQWNYTMGNVDVAHRLMMAASLPSSTSLSSQQALAFKLFTVLITNSYRVWTLFKNKTDLVNRLTHARSGDDPTSNMRDSAKQLLRRESFHEFVEFARCVLLDMANDPDPKWEDQILGAANPENKRNGPVKKRRRRQSANSKGSTERRMDRSFAHNEVRLNKPRWCMVCSQPVRKEGKSIMIGHTTSYKCEHCDVPLCQASRFPCFRLYHSMNFLQHTPRDCRGYRERDQCSDNAPINSDANISQIRVSNSAASDQQNGQSQPGPEQATTEARRQA